MGRLYGVLLIVGQREEADKFAYRYRIKSARRENWDYSKPGIYFVTICTLHHNSFLGKIVDGKMELSPYGQIAQNEILNTIRIRKNIKITDWTIMPNHIHMIIKILFMVETPRRDVSTYKTKNIHKPEIAISFWKSNSLGSIICQYKSITSKRIKKIPKFFAWQTRFYDKIIMNNKEFFTVRQYIANNPKNWKNDIYYKN